MGIIDHVLSNHKGAAVHFFSNKKRGKKCEEKKKEKDRRNTRFEVVSCLIYMVELVQRYYSSSTSWNVNKAQIRKTAINFVSISIHSILQQKNYLQSTHPCHAT